MDQGSEKKTKYKLLEKNRILKKITSQKNIPENPCQMSQDISKTTTRIALEVVAGYWVYELKIKKQV